MLMIVKTFETDAIVRLVVSLSPKLRFCVHKQWWFHRRSMIGAVATGGLLGAKPPVIYFSSLRNLYAKMITVYKPNGSELFFQDTGRCFNRCSV